MEKLTFWQKLVGSADNFTKNAFSARKLTALTIMIIGVVTGHVCYYWYCCSNKDFSKFDTILIIDYIAVGFFLGLITVQNIISLKNGTSTTTETTTESSETTTETKENGN